MSEKDFSELMKFIVQVPGAIAFLFIAVKWVISDWFKKNSEIEFLKSELKDKDTQHLKDRVEELEKLIKEHNLRVVSYSGHMDLARKEINALTGKVDDFSVKTYGAINEYARLTHERLLFLEDFNKDLREKMNKSEKIPIGKDSLMVRTKKD